MIKFRNRYKEILPQAVLWARLYALVSVVSCSLGILLAYYLPEIPDGMQQRLYPICIVSAILCSGVGILGGRRSIASVLFFIAGYCLFTGNSIYVNRINHYIAHYAATEVAMEVRVVTPPAPKKDQFTFLATILKINDDPHVPLTGKMVVCCSKDFPQAPSLLRFSGTIHPAKSRAFRYDYDEQAYMSANGIAGRVTISRIISMEHPRRGLSAVAMHFRNHLTKVLKLYRNPDHRALIRASFTGEKEYIAPEITAAFVRSGLIHILALSGFNAAILLVAMYSLLAMFPLRTTLKHLIALAGLWIYFAFVGPIPSLTRAVIMATLVVASLIFQRKNYPLQTLCIAALCWLFFFPSSLFQPGFQLSYGATFGILTLHPLFMRLYPNIKNPIPDYFVRILYSSLSVSVAATLTTLPILIYHFGTFSLYGILANIVAIPLMAGAMWTFFIALLLYSVQPFLGGLCIAVSGGMTDGLLYISNGVNYVGLSFSDIPAPYGELIFFYYCMLLVIILIAHKHVVKLAVVLIPVFICSIPCSFLFRTCLQPHEVFLLPNGSRLPIVAFRKGTSATWVYSPGDEHTISNLVRSIGSWKRHAFSAGRTNVNIVMGNNTWGIINCVTGAVERTFNADTLIIASNNSSGSCLRSSCIPEDWQFTISNGLRSFLLHCIDNSNCVITDSSGIIYENVSVPCRILIGKNKNRVYSFK